MKAENVVSCAASNNVLLTVKNGKLVAKSNTDIMPDLLSMLRTYKQELLEHFRQEEEAYYIHYYQERAGIMEHDAGLSTAEAERKALRETCIEWICRNSTSIIDTCTGCGGVTGRGGIAAWGGHCFHWDNDKRNCLKPYLKQRMPEAKKALATMGINHIEEEKS